MNKLLIGLALVAGLLLAPTGLKKVQQYTSRALSEIRVNSAYQQQALPPASSALESSTPKILDVQETLILEEKNTVVFRGPVTDSSVANAMRNLQAVSRRVSKDTPILLVLDTPGGDIMSGQDLIDFAKALPQKVHTVTLFAASMGFQIAQALDTRYVARTGTLMSHRARLEGLGGQVKGELETRYKMIRRAVDFLDVTAAQRMGLDLKAYEEKIFNELWVYGYDAVGEKVADKQVLVRCGDSMNGSYDQVYETFIGSVVVTFSKCPLIRAPEAIKLGGVPEDKKLEVTNAVRMSISNQRQFVQDYILTNRFYSIFK